jgi:hypothetical protein
LKAFLKSKEFGPMHQSSFLGQSGYPNGIDKNNASGYSISSRKGKKMSNKKTAISIEQPLFGEVDALAEELQVSRSRLFSLAAREYVERHKSRKLFDAINAAHLDSPDATEKGLNARMKSKHRRLVKEKW